MSINWVMLTNNNQDFVRLPSEQSLYTSPARVSINLDSINKFPGRQPYTLSSPAGKIHLTNRRIIYLPATPPPQTSNQAPPTVLASFAAPLTNLHDAHVTTPWLGPNAWVALVQPVLGGGIPSHHAAVEVRLTFKDGGAYDFHTRYCELRERVAQARDMGVDAPRRRGGGDAPDVHLEQLPAYDEGRGAPAPVAAGGGAGVQEAASEQAAVAPAPSQGQDAPADPPPGYEETQRDSLVDLLETTDMGLRQRRT